MLGFLVLLSPAAQAQPRGKLADTLFKEGREAFDKGDYARACPKFAESHQIDPAPGTLLNLAVCEERTGKLVSAREHLTALLPQLPPKDDRVPFVKDLLKKLDARVSRLSLTLGPGAPKETEVKDEPEGKVLPVGVEILLDPGEHTFVISAPGRPADQLRITLSAGQRETRAVTPLPVPVQQQVVTGATGPDKPGGAPAKGDDTSGSNLRRTLGFAAGGVGVAALGVAAVTGVVLLGKKAAVATACPNKMCPDEASTQTLNDARSTPLLPVNTVSWIVGILGVGAGVTLILTSGIGSGSGSKSTAAPSAAAFVTATPGGGGLGIRGRF